MSKTIRFAWVSNNRVVKHRFYAKKFVEGEQALCGTRVQAGWSFWYGKRNDPRWGDLIARECTHCLTASQRQAPVSTLCAVCDQIKELHPASHPWTARTTSETKVDEAFFKCGFCGAVAPKGGHVCGDQFTKDSASNRGTVGG